VLVCAGIKGIQSMEIINTSSQACPNSTYFIGLLIDGYHNTQDLNKKVPPNGMCNLLRDHTIKNTNK
jgi:hypothetical protein